MILRKTLAATVAVALSFGALPPLAQAGVIGTEQSVQAIAAPESGTSREQLTRFLQREDVALTLSQRGVDRQAALDRVAALSDAEVAQLAGRIDQLPAGSSDVLGLVFTVFIILLVTDILGLTKVFPFTRSVR